MYEELVKRLLSYVDLHCPMDRTSWICGRSDARKAAEAILELRKPRWIPVAELLPEKYHQVLVYGLNGMQIDYYAGEKSIGGRPLFMISEAKVTHWMPLPEPPKEEDHGA